MLITAESKNVNKFNKLSCVHYILNWLETNCMCVTVLVRMCNVCYSVGKNV
jgi:hypothetical protein